MNTKSINLKTNSLTSSKGLLMKKKKKTFLKINLLKRLTNVEKNVGTNLICRERRTKESTNWRRSRRSLK